jgi:hypothetical protein
VRVVPEDLIEEERRSQTAERPEGVECERIDVDGFAIRVLLAGNAHAAAGVVELEARAPVHPVGDVGVVDGVEAREVAQHLAHVQGDADVGAVGIVRAGVRHLVIR